MSSAFGIEEHEHQSVSACMGVRHVMEEQLNASVIPLLPLCQPVTEEKTFVFFSAFSDLYSSRCVVRWVFTVELNLKHTVWIMGSSLMNELCVCCWKTGLTNRRISKQTLMLHEPWPRGRGSGTLDWKENHICFYASRLSHTVVTLHACKLPVVHTHTEACVGFTAWQIQHAEKYWKITVVCPHIGTTLNVKEKRKWAWSRCWLLTKYGTCSQIDEP